MTKHLAGNRTLKNHPFCLVDVGVSGGIDGYWEIFGPDLRAVAFDGLIREIERLNAAEGGPDRRYFPLLVGDKSYHLPCDALDTQPFPRTSAAQAAEISACNYAKTYFDQTGTGETATEMIELDQFFLRDHPTNVDFIKIDTDGSDYQVLRGGKELLSASQVLGVAVECQFHGLVHDESNTFRNIDRLLTAQGFSLFDLEVYRYSRAALPKPFIYPIPAQTHGGQVLWGDALYFRDAGCKEYEHDWSVTLPPQKIVKLACMFEIFGMEDCAAELLLKYRPNLGPLIDVDSCLNMLTPRLDGRRLSYQEYTRDFERNPASFYPAK